MRAKFFKRFEMALKEITPEILKKFRLEDMMVSQAEVAKSLGYCPAMVSKVEGGYHDSYYKMIMFYFICSPKFMDWFMERVIYWDDTANRDYEKEKQVKRLEEYRKRVAECRDGKRKRGVKRNGN